MSPAKPYGSDGIFFIHDPDGALVYKVQSHLTEHLDSWQTTVRRVGEAPLSKDSSKEEWEVMSSNSGVIEWATDEPRVSVNGDDYRDIFRKVGWRNL